MAELRVVLDVRFVPGTFGGTESVAMGLAQGFAALGPDLVSITYLGYAGHEAWLAPHLRPWTDVVLLAPPNAATSRALMHRAARVTSLRLRHGNLGVLPPADRFLKALKPHVVHYPFQGGGRTQIPSVYQPHDLIHRHYPQFLPRRHVMAREVTYGFMCRQAAAVAVGTSWIREDVIQQMRLDPAKVHVVPLAPFLDATPASTSADGVLRALPDRFVYYPAGGWPHKNHCLLFAAIAALRHEGLEVPLVLSGPRTPLVDLAELAKSAGVADLVVDLAYLDAAAVPLVLSRAAALVMPTLFEAESLPVWEAFRAGVAVASSNVTSLPRQVGDAALLFDPLSSTSIAAALADLWTDKALCERLSDRGRARVGELSWARTARHFAALYRSVGGVSLTSEDRALLAADPGI